MKARDPLIAAPAAVAGESAGSASALASPLMTPTPTPTLPLSHRGTGHANNTSTTTATPALSSPAKHANAATSDLKSDRPQVVTVVPTPRGGETSGSASTTLATPAPSARQKRSLFYKPSPAQTAAGGSAPAPVAVAAGPVDGHPAALLPSRLVSGNHREPTTAAPSALSPAPTPAHKRVNLEAGGPFSSSPYDATQTSPAPASATLPPTASSPHKPHAFALASPGDAPHKSLPLRHLPPSTTNPSTQLQLLPASPADRENARSGPSAIPDPVPRPGLALSSLPTPKGPAGPSTFAGSSSSTSTRARDGAGAGASRSDAGSEAAPTPAPISVPAEAHEELRGAWQHGQALLAEQFKAGGLAGLVEPPLSPRVGVGLGSATGMHAQLSAQLHGSAQALSLSQMLCERWAALEAVRRRRVQAESGVVEDKSKATGGRRQRDPGVGGRLGSPRAPLSPADEQRALYEYRTRAEAAAKREVLQAEARLVQERAQLEMRRAQMAVLAKQRVDWNQRPEPVRPRVAGSSSASLHSPVQRASTLALAQRALLEAPSQQSLAVTVAGKPKKPHSFSSRSAAKKVEPPQRARTPHARNKGTFAAAAAARELALLPRGGAGGGSDEAALADGGMIVAADLAKIRRKLTAAAYTAGGLNWHKLFKFYDRDNSSKLNLQEFTSALRRDAKLTVTALSDSAVAHLFAALDSDHSGSLSLQEFVAWLEAGSGGGQASRDLYANTPLDKSKPKASSTAPRPRSANPRGERRPSASGPTPGSGSGSGRPQSAKPALPALSYLDKRVELVLRNFHVRPGGGGKRIGGAPPRSKSAGRGDAASSLSQRGGGGGTRTARPPTAGELALVRAKLQAVAFSERGVSWPKLFARFDKDSSGGLTLAEFRRAVRSEARLPATQLSEAALTRLFVALDRDNSGVLELGEFLSFVEAAPSDYLHPLAVTSPPRMRTDVLHRPPPPPKRDSELSGPVAAEPESDREGRPPDPACAPAAGPGVVGLPGTRVVVGRGAGGVVDGPSPRGGAQQAAAARLTAASAAPPPAIGTPRRANRSGFVTSAGGSVVGSNLSSGVSTPKERGPAGRSSTHNIFGARRRSSGSGPGSGRGAETAWGGAKLRSEQGGVAPAATLFSTGVGGVGVGVSRTPIRIQGGRKQVTSSPLITLLKITQSACSARFLTLITLITLIRSPSDPASVLSLY
jgi:Ca2+-binding EF-hand superfamily protein